MNPCFIIFYSQGKVHRGKEFVVLSGVNAVAKREIYALAGDRTPVVGLEA
jgi:hypothetical protein